MMENTKYEDQDYIDLYILNKLSPQERLEFEKRLQTDEALAEELLLSQYIVNGLANEKLEKILASLPNEVDISSILSDKKPKVGKRNMLIAVASMAAAITLCILYIGLGSRYSSSELYSAYYVAQTYDQAPTRGSNLLTEAQQMQLNEAIQYYEEGNFAEALNSFDSITKETALKDIPEEVLFYSSVCFIETGKVDAAITRLTDLASNGAIFSEDAKWNLALLYLKKDNRDKALPILEDLTVNGKLYKQSSIELVAKLKEKRWF